MSDEIKNDFEQQNDKKEYNIKSEIFSWTKTILGAVLVAFIITRFIIVNAVIPSGSMETTIMTNDRIVAFRLSYIFEEPERYDIVVFKFPDDENFDYIKRVIGLPGETVEIKDDKVYINGSDEPLDDSFIKEEMVGSWGPFVVPEDSYFMLGDNRNFSKDSRYWRNPFVKKDKILGKAIFRYYPTPKKLFDA